MAKRVRGQLIDGWLQCSEELVVGLDRSGTVQFVTDGFLGYYPEADLGSIFWECLALDPLVRWVSDCLDSTDPEVREQIMSHRPECLWMARLDPVIGSGGRCTGWILRLKDIQPLERLSERLDALVSDVRRRLREPLIAMKSRLELLLEGEDKDPVIAHELLREINEDTNLLAKLLFSLEDPGQPAPPSALEGTDVGSTVTAVFNTFEPLARAKNLALKMRLAGDFAPLFGLGQGELERCLVNIVDNAIKYTALNGYGEIVIRAQLDSDAGKPGILFLVDDSGPGIPAAYRTAVFDQFYRMAEGPTAQLGGTGLGLWRVFETASERGGRVWIEDSSLGGAGLRLFFPTSLEDGLS